jgi:hypothetical protein
MEDLLTINTVTDPPAELPEWPLICDTEWAKSLSFVAIETTWETGNDVLEEVAVC